MPKPIWKRSCQQCGTKLKLAPFGGQKRFCSDACRQAAFRNEMTANKAPYPTKGYENCASELIETQNDFLSRNEELELSPSSARSSKRLTFEKQNRLTYKLTDGVQINTGSGRASRALGCVMEVVVVAKCPELPQEQTSANHAPMSPNDPQRDKCAEACNAEGTLHGIVG